MLKSYALRTSLIMDKFFATVTENSDYIVIKTPQRPDYFWGNYIIMKSPPTHGDFEDWISIFELEIGTRNELGYVAIGIDTIDGDDCVVEEFKENGFDIQVSKILLAENIIKPRKFNDLIEVRPYSSEEDWANYLEIHFTPNWNYGTEAEQKEFLKDEMESFRRFVKSENAQRYGAFLNGEMIAELGVFWEGNVARFNNVATHSDHRRKGACSSLVYHVSKMMLDRSEITTLVMEADEDYHAARIYEEVGFEPTQRLISLEWVQ